MESLLGYVILGIFSLQLLLILVLGFFYTQERDFSGSSGYKEVSVIIPFKDEEGRIGPLLKSINDLSLKGLEVEFLFVDDHSNDNTINIIRTQLKKPFKIISSTGRGKKVAIRGGIKRAQNDSILTWDADITVPRNYFDELSHLTERDMWILPVRLKSQSFVSKLGTVDYAWLQLLNFTFAIKKDPIVASGANLLFSKAKFLEVDGRRSDYDIVSGDDMFLMHTFKNAGYTIGVTNNRSFEVTTESPDNFEDLIMQRKRWSGKMKHISSPLGKSAGLLVILLSLLNVLSLLLGAAWGEVLIFFAFGIKVMSEYFLQRFYKGGKDILSDIPLILAHQFFFPFYLLSIASSKKVEKKWS
jgi:cellulose synthase/poly-beta-1,6-N-acetylglucosamine synthase-like glycosyltransferase